MIVLREFNRIILLRLNCNMKLEANWETIYLVVINA